MKLKAVITAAGKSQRTLPLQTLVGRDGTPKTALAIIVEEALNAASKIGDDTLQRKSQGQVVPESFTHGTSQQRVTWFKRGFESGDMQQCDTFTPRSI